MRHLFATRLVLAAAVSAALAMFTPAVQAEAPFAFAATPGKLPKDVVPVQYAAHLVPDLKANTFLGSQTIEIDVLRTTSAIKLNVANIEIDAASLTGTGFGERKLTPVIDQEQQVLSFALAEPLPPGRYQLALKFHGAINREARGIFSLKYKAGAAEKAMLATNMEPSDARRLLPLWDEPAFRANFKLTVDLPVSFKAFSNTPVEKQEKLDGGLQRFSFAVTPKMPSYLLVLVAGELERASIKYGGVDIGVVTTEGKLPTAAYALGATKNLLRYYNGYFGQPYPLPKLDQIAIPGGFNGAMENWGGIVYNETTLLFDPKTSPESQRQNSFEINAHEVAHQWFGNLVTMAWWDNLWLNEGFASWMATKATEHFHPEWRAQLRAMADRDGVMTLDARKTTHPIQTPVLTEEQAADAFDAITYVKGQAFLHMLEDYLGEDAFRKGIRAYMAQHKYSNTTSADLWAALEKASGKPVEQLASDWTTVPGYPVLGVSQACENGKRRVTLTQEQYRIDEPAREKRLWNVPVQVGVVNGKAAYTLLSTPSMTMTQPSCDGALVIDPRSVGYYRVQYDRPTFDALAGQVGKLADTTRLKLLLDTYSLAGAGRVGLDGYFKLLEKYRDEPRLAIWSAIGRQLVTLDEMTDAAPEQAALRRFMTATAASRFARLGWQIRQGESAEERQLRPLLATILARGGHPEAIAFARKNLAAYLANPASVDPSMLGFVVSVGGRDADLKTYELIAARMLQTQNSEERNRLARALAGARDPALAARTLALALNEQLPAAVTSRFVPAVASNGHVDLAWKFATAHRQALMKDQEAGGQSKLFPAVVSSSSDPAHAGLMEDYVKHNFGPDAQAEAARVANAIRTRAAQKSALLPQIRAALQ
ncbi:M1 family metallopeptidase [Massilia sp. PAMC28688]|uniref:M1 family metallopeptidase n=1 Tax=Massilia sp. PAMC28688 TaxID=2861283 RepID=UPI001C63905A|nr:M1 family metallopeptidase [Massilia sp. PAMC28688]QYF94092.1 M1 family metallopeptidase [Massilia sp. PAMC28688]